MSPPGGPGPAARVATQLVRHWLALWLGAALVLTALPVAAPVLAAGGHARAAGALYVAFRPLCHQLPQHSWFLFGRAATYDWATLQPLTGASRDRPLDALHHPVTDGVLGHQLAVCQRDIATYLGLLALSVVYALTRRPRGVGWRLYALGVAPLALDGATQLMGWRASTPLLRTVTGALFGAATAAFVLPQLEAAAAAHRDARRAARAQEAAPPFV